MAESHPDMRRGIAGEGKLEVCQDDTIQCRVVNLRWPVTDMVSGATMADFYDRVLLEDIDLSRRVRGTDEPIPQLQEALTVIKRRWQALNQTSGDFIEHTHDDIVKILAGS